MEFRFGLSLTVLLVAAVTRGQAELKCYVCDNCAKIDKNTPLETCGPAVLTTVTLTTPTEATSTPTTASSTTDEGTTEEQTATKSTAFPTPPTIGPQSSTTGVPTPPNVGPDDIDVVELAENHSHTPTVNATSTISEQTVYFVTPSHEGSTTILPLENTSSEQNSTASSPLQLRRRRDIPVDGMTYHCYKVEKKYNSAYGVQRGCMGVLTEQSVCGELKAANNNQTKKCQPCSTSMCNSSSTLGVSMATLLIALVALVYRV